jgi:hypothetical protein
MLYNMPLLIVLKFQQRVLIIMPSFMCWVGSKTYEGDDVCIYVVDPQHLRLYADYSKFYGTKSVYINDNIYAFLGGTKERAGKKYISDGVFDLNVDKRDCLGLKFRPEERLAVSEMKKLLVKPNQSLLCIMNIYEFKALREDLNFPIRLSNSNIKHNQIVKAGFFAPIRETFLPPKLERKQAVSPQGVERVEDVFDDAFPSPAEVSGVGTVVESPLSLLGTPESTPDVPVDDCYPGCSMS